MGRADDWDKWLSKQNEAFWSFAVATYGKPGVAAACLALQDRHGADVNLLLLALYYAENGWRLDPAEARVLRGVSDDLQGRFLRPQRKIRRGLKEEPGAGAAYQSAKELELKLERLAQERLLSRTKAPSHAEGAADPRALAAANLATVTAAEDEAGALVRLLYP